MLETLKDQQSPSDLYVRRKGESSLDNPGDKTNTLTADPQQEARGNQVLQQEDAKWVGMDTTTLPS